MKKGNLVAGILFVSVGVISTTQLLATCMNGKSYKTNVVYTMHHDTKADATREEYEQRSIEALKTFCGIDLSNPSLEMKMDMNIYTVQDDIESYKWVIEADTKAYEKSQQIRAAGKKVSKEEYDKAIKELEEKKITQAQFNEINDIYVAWNNMVTKEEIEREIKSLERRKKEDYDRIVCLLYYNKPGEKDKVAGTCMFNGNTKEIMLVDNIEAYEGAKVEKPSQSEINKLKEASTKFLEEHPFGGVKTPVCVKVDVGSFLELVFEDKKDQTKRVYLELDIATGNLVDIETVN